MSIGRAELGFAYAWGMASKPDPMDFAHRLNEACDIVDWPRRGRASMFARKMGVAGPTAHAWVTGKHMPEPERVREMARFMGIRYEWLYFGDGQMVEDPLAHKTDAELEKDGAQWFQQQVAAISHVEIPVWDARAAAGNGSINDSATGPKGSILFRERSLAKKGIRPETSHVCYVHGESMTPRLRDGDAVLFDTSETIVRPGKVYVIRKGDEVFIKRLFPEAGRIRVSSDNKGDPQWADWFVDSFDPDFTVVGRVRWVGSWEE